MFRSCACLLAVAASLSSASVAAQPPKPPPKPPAVSPAQKKPTPPRPPAKPVVTAPEPPKYVPPDLEVVTSYTTGETTTTSTVQLKGARARIGLGDTLASLLQCDKQQSVQLNTQTRTFMAVPFSSEPSSAPAVSSEPRKKGGEVVYTTTLTDTGDVQTLFGFTARHIKTLVVKDFTPTACDKTPQRVETDGWYMELPATLSCASVPATRMSTQADPQRADCVDEVRYEQPQTRLGYPVKYTSVSTTGDAAPVRTTMEVSRLERSDLQAAAFEVPADFVAVRSVIQLTADHRPGEPGAKKPGTLRVGMMPIGNKSGAKFVTADLDEALLESFTDTELDLVRLAGTTRAELEADAKAKDVDLLLNTTIAEVKSTARGGIGGLVGKVTGSGGEAFTAKVDYALVAPGQTKPRSAGSERSGGPSTLNTAIALAKKVMQFAPPMMMAKYGYMNAYGQMLNAGGPSGAMKQTQDPVMSVAFSLLDRAVPPQPTEQFTTEEGAVASALEKEIKSVVSDLAKKK